MSRSFEIVIFGASGFTGEYVVENLAKYLAKKKKNLCWAAAGRSEAKVRSSLTSIGTRIGINFDSVPVITATVGDDASLDAMTKQAVLLINCTGPFRYYGEEVVVSCLRNSCHYIDISGEPQFLEKIQLKYHEEAKEKGVYIIPSCGFDSVPCDLGVNFIKDSFKPGVLNSVETYLTTGVTTGNHTTWECAVEGIADTNTLISIRRQLYREHFPEVMKIRSKFPIQQKGLTRFSDAASGLSGWIMPFIGADRSVVRRSQMDNYKYFNEKDMVQMEAYVIHTLFVLLRWIGAGVWLKLLYRFGWGRTLLKQFPSFFTYGMFTMDGPTRHETDTTNFSIHFLGKGWKEGDDRDKPPTSTIAAKVTGPHPGYPTCAICVNQSALMVLEEKTNLPLNGGVFTPGTAFRNTSLIKRLNENGVVFQLIY